MVRKKWETMGKNIFVTILPMRDNTIMFMMTICEFVKGNSNLDKEEEDKNGFGFQSPKVFLN
jgi:hypothetical protein